MLIVKIGGGRTLDLTAICTDLARLDKPLVVLHGANHLRNALAEALDKPPVVVESVSGYTSVLSDDDAIDVLMAAYAGVRNKRLVEALRTHGCNAIGLCGLDGGVIEGTRNAGIRIKRDGRKMLVRDHSGKPQRINTGLLEVLLDRGYTPVLTVPIAGEDGSALNSENDDVLARLAEALPVTDVVSLIEAPGLLGDPHDEGSLVDTVDVTDLGDWETRVDGRMRRKVRALASLFAAVGGRPLTVHVADGRVHEPVTRALAGRGTVIRSPAAPEGHETAQDAVWIGRQQRVELDVYGKRDVALVRGKGVRVWDAGGREYIDCVAGHGSLNLGHRHPALVAAIHRQSEQLVCCPGSFATPARTEFLEALAAVTPSGLDRAFLSNSGTEAVEAALKIARRHTGRTDFVAMERGFHGRTLGSLSVTAEPRFRDGFGPLIPGVRRVPFNSIEPLVDALDDSVAAVIVEPVQGEGGVRIPDSDYLSQVRRACDERGALLILDEIQTGFGRTGTMFAFERFGIVPDVLCLAKSLAGGLPLGATVVRDDIEMPVGSHGSTFGGNPVACAAGVATLGVLTGDGFLNGVQNRGQQLAERIHHARLDAVREVRQIGLMVGIELKTRVRPYLPQLQERGVLALAAGSRVLRLLPPLVIDGGELDAVADAVIGVLRGTGG